MRPMPPLRRMSLGLVVLAIIWYSSGPCTQPWRRLSRNIVEVAPAGFEPAISALRGLRPRPLDDGAAALVARRPECLGRRPDQHRQRGCEEQANAQA
jgi:hypothetical protein